MIPSIYVLSCLVVRYHSFGDLHIGSQEQTIVNDQKISTAEQTPYPVSIVNSSLREAKQAFDSALSAMEILLSCHPFPLAHNRLVLFVLSYQ